MGNLIKTACGAAIFISLGVAVLFLAPAPYGAFLFAFGLFGVCSCKCSLFTGMCGFVRSKTEAINVFLVLIVNCLSGWIYGAVLAIANPEIMRCAQARVSTWECSWEFFIKAFCCGIVMFCAVLIYRLGSPLGIFFGVPLFILCGFQHCIANVIICGAAFTFDWSMIICIIGNLCGSLFMSLLLLKPQQK